MTTGLVYDHGTSGVTLYAIILNTEPEVWNGTSFEWITVANWGTYDIPLVEDVVGTSIYTMQFPDLPSGRYLVSVRVQVGASPAITDAVAYTELVDWDAIEEITQTRLDHKVDDNQAFIIAK